MINKKVLCFDLFNTLIKENPLFVNEYAKYIYDNSSKLQYLYPKFNSFTINHINTKLNEIIKDLNENIEKHSLHYNNSDIYKIIANLFNIDRINSVQLQRSFEYMFLHNYPLLINNQISDVLLTLSKKYKIILCSDTLLFDGIILKQALVKALKIMAPDGINTIFSEFVFSDEISYSKNHIEFYKKIHMNAMVNKDHILYITSNDIKGIINYGIDSLQVNSIDIIETIKNI